ncbi:uncharacterized protein LOC110739084 [Chenopodium quinoa]|uniref:uncharacterized protein LOC110739084 n=1 Tax=Chenopodium quinoa TaxID=63459 RepID=UPI000B76F2D4|nr:uncharacterized protein LOC110739084 [Chenopodium quinoa]
MILTVWNVRGLNDPCKVADIKQLLNRTKTDVLCLLETRVKQKKCTGIQKQISHGLSWVCNYSCSEKGRIWLGWKSERLHIEVITVHTQFIHCIVSSLDYSRHVAVSFVYGLHDIHDRRELWSGIRAIGPVSLPWICTGDFNSILQDGDRINGSEITDYEVRDFKDFIEDMGFVEIKSKGSRFYWSNKAYCGPRTQTRIDRVHDVWSGGTHGSPMSRVWKKFKSLKVKLKQLNHHSFRNVEMRIDLAQQALLDIQDQMASDPHSPALGD